MFGIEYKSINNYYFPYSDIEKTFIDMIYYKQHIDKETLKEFKKRINKKKLKSYLKKYPELMRMRAEKELKKE